MRCKSNVAASGRAVTYVGRTCDSTLLLVHVYVSAIIYMCLKQLAIFFFLFAKRNNILAVVLVKITNNNVDVFNYRGITLLSTLGKLFTSILNN